MATSAPVDFAAELDRIGDRAAARTRVDDWVWSRDYAVPLVERKLGVRSLEGFGLNGHPCAAIAAGVVLHYVQSTQKLDAVHLTAEAHHLVAEEVVRVLEDLGLFAP